MKAFGTIAAIALLATISSAHADWDFTSWGMEPHQVVASSNGRAVQIAAGSVSCMFKGTTCGAVMPSYSVGPFVFEVRFGFDAAANLNSVLLYSGMNKFYELERALMGTFGTPLSADGGHFPSRIWRDTNRGNQVRLIGIGGEAIVEYKPITTGF